MDRNSARSEVRREKVRHGIGDLTPSHASRKNCPRPTPIFASPYYYRGRPPIFQATHRARPIASDFSYAGGGGLVTGRFSPEKFIRGENLPARERGRLDWTSHESPEPSRPLRETFIRHPYRNMFLKLSGTEPVGPEPLARYRRKVSAFQRAARVNRQFLIPYRHRRSTIFSRFKSGPAAGFELPLKLRASGACSRVLWTNS
jgi:hypothetical protein